MLCTIYIAVGSNIEPERNILGALSALQEQMEVTACSTFYWSAALERPEQPLFLNGVWEARTERTPQEVKFDCLRPIEHQLGRQRTADKHAARPMDLDLLLHGQTALESKELSLPDSDIPTRAFLWQPLHELAPELLERLELRPTASALAPLESNFPITHLLRQALASHSKLAPKPNTER